jgi:plastocyanin
MRRVLMVLLPCAVIVLVAVFSGCSKDKGTNPTVGGAPRLNLSLPGGGTNQFTFADAGAVVYKCGIHSFMNNDTVFVDPAAADMDANVSIVDTPSMRFSPRSVHIKPGGTVHWSNPTGTLHSVVNQ